MKRSKIVNIVLCECYHMKLYEIKYTLYTVSPSESPRLTFSHLLFSWKSHYLFRSSIILSLRYFYQSHTSSCWHNMTTVVFLNFKNPKNSLFLMININEKVGRPTISKCPIRIDTSHMAICSFKTVSIHKIYSLRLKQH